MSFESSAAPETTLPNSASSDAQSTKYLSVWDRVGGWLSAACAIHCLVTPFITLSLPFWVYTIHYSPVHLAVALFVIPIGIFAFWHGYRKHGKAHVVALGVLGLGLMLVSLFAPATREQLRWNDLMALSGSCFLIVAHGLNRWNLQRGK